MTQWHRGSATALAAAYARREVSPEDVLQSCLDRLVQINPVLNAVIAQNRAAAKAAASASAARWRAGTPIGALDGIPFTVKDNIVTADLPTTWGSPLFRDYRATLDELPVARLLQAGAVLIGKCNLLEFAYGIVHPDYGQCNNPWDTQRTSGGSSSGSANGA